MLQLNRAALHSEAPNVHFYFFLKAYGFSFLKMTSKAKLRVNTLGGQMLVIEGC